MIVQNKRLTGILITASIILSIPYIAMQFTKEVIWTLSDFFVAGVLLIATSLMCELVLRKINKTGLRIAICIAILTTLLLIWAELAVGIFGTVFAGT